MELNFQTTYNAATKIWSGPIVPSNHAEDSSLGKVLLAALVKNPAHVGQICHPSGKAYTNKELATLSISVAQHFSKLGLRQCDIIGICASNTDFLAPLVFGAMLKGLAVATLDISYDKNGIKHAFGLTKPKLVFCDGGNYVSVKEALHELGLNSVVYTMKDHINGEHNIMEFLKLEIEALVYNCEPLKMGLTQTAAILFSSGTTGLPKGVNLSNEDLLDMIVNTKLPQNEYFLNFSTLHWFSGLTTLLICTSWDLTRIISDKPYSSDDFFDIVAKYRVSILLTPPSQMAMLLASPRLKNADLSSIHTYHCAGSAVPYAVVKQIQEFMPKTNFYTNYAMTETRCLVALGEIAEKTGFIGKLGPNVQVKIIDNDGQKLGPTEIGEVFIKTPRKWLGYFDNAMATAATYDANGWIASGDLGYIDEQGRLYLVDRKKDILKYNNFHYFPTEIEEVIYELNDVLEVCVCGLPDLVSTDLPAAAVVKKVGSNLTEQQIYDHVAQRMEYFKHLRGGVYFVDKMPLTSTGKILRNEVKKICEKLKLEGSINKN